MLKLITVLAFLFCSVSCEQKTLKLSIYYETLCPDSTRFFRTQLNTTYEKIGSILSIDFVPYGFASHHEVNGKWAIQCQHGQKECRGNKFHACELAQGNGQVNDVKFLDCSMSNRDPTSHVTLQRCADSVGIDFSPVEQCYNSGQGDELLVKYGERTKAVVPKLKYVPTIIINDVYSQKVQNDAEVNLLATICNHLEAKPDGCH